MVDCCQPTGIGTQYMSALVRGSHLGDEFIVDQELGSGSFGITYSVRALKDMPPYIRRGESYVIKEYFPRDLVQRGPDDRIVPRGTSEADVRNNSERFDRFLDKFVEEALALSMFQHPNIVAVYTMREGNNTAYMVMEHIEGVSFSSAIDSHRQIHHRGLSGSQAEILLHPLIDALGEVHRHGLLHRDIKPANIMMRCADEPVLIDFGGAAPIVDANRSVVLTYGFAPSEQREGHSISMATDIYSLAATFYYSITGDLVIEGGGQNSRMNPLLSEHPRRTEFGLSDEFADGLDWALDYHNPANRPQNVSEWCTRLFPSIAESGAPSLSIFDTLPTGRSSPNPDGQSISDDPSSSSGASTPLVNIRQGKDDMGEEWHPTKAEHKGGGLSGLMIGLAATLLIMFVTGTGLLLIQPKPSRLAEPEIQTSVRLNTDTWTRIDFISKTPPPNGGVSFTSDGPFRIRVNGAMYSVVDQNRGVALPHMTSVSLVEAKAIGKNVVVDVYY